MSTNISKHSSSYSGSCLCGSIRYSINGKLRDVINCHCSFCRKFHGHYGAYTATDKKRILISDNDNTLMWYQSSGNPAKRGFCMKCGSSLFWDLEGDTLMRISAGTLDQPTCLITTTDIHVLDKSDYYELSNKTKKHKQGL